MKISRKRVIASGAAAGAWSSIAFLRYPGEAAQFSFKLANDQTATHPMNVATAAAVKRIQDASNGQIEINVFANSALGSDPQMMTQIRSGALELLQLGSNILGSVVPAAAFLTLPFAFQSSKELLSSSNGPLGAYIAAACERIGIRKFQNGFYGGTFQMQNRLRPINVPGDLRGIKMRVPPGPIDVATFKAFDAAPTVISLAEVYTSLQTHLVDGIEVPLPTVQNFKYYEQVKFCSITNHSSLVYLMLANAAAWQKLPKNLQDILDKELGAAADAASTSMASQEVTIEATLRGEGMEFNRPATEPFRQIIRNSGLYAQWRDQYDPKGWDALEKTTGKLA
ncbi:MAG TPA: TRAP transporter substrate-binding protein [Candidatus Acidoferrales bacterium]|nr:TRAP transporter substrate-binding protein [Candidatus Acidoferrales bacterium]